MINHDDDATMLRFGGSRVLLMRLNPVSSHQLASIIDLIEDGGISGKIGKEVLTVMIEEGVATNKRHRLADDIVTEKGWGQLSDQQQLVISSIQQKHSYLTVTNTLISFSCYPC